MLELGPEQTFLGHDFTQGERKDNSGACVDLCSPGVAGGEGGGQEDPSLKGMLSMKTQTPAGSPLTAVFQFPFGCLCECGIVSPTRDTCIVDRI